MVRDQNQLADHLSKLGSSRAAIPLGVFIQDLLAPSIKEDKKIQEVPPVEQLVLTVPSLAADRREQFIKYLSSAEVPADKTEIERLIHQSKHYVPVDGNSMRKSAKEGILQKCITQEDGVKLLLEIHSISYGNHAASRTLIGKAFRADFYWPTAISDAEDFVRRCEGCQFFAKQIHMPAQELQTILASWPFAC